MRKWHREVESGRDSTTTSHLEAGNRKGRGFFHFPGSLGSLTSNCPPSQGPGTAGLHGEDEKKGSRPVWVGTKCSKNSISRSHPSATGAIQACENLSQISCAQGCTLHTQT